MSLNPRSFQGTKLSTLVETLKMYNEIFDEEGFLSLSGLPLRLRYDV